MLFSNRPGAHSDVVSGLAVEKVNQSIKTRDAQASFWYPDGCLRYDCVEEVSREIW